MAIKSITKHNIDSIKGRLEGAMRADLEDMGLELTWGRGTYNSSNFSTKLTVAIIGETGVEGDGFNPNSREATDFNRCASRYGLKADDLGKTFEWRGETVRILGAKPNNRKYPIIIAKSDGRRYKFAAYDVRDNLARERA